uniref:Protein RER1 n=1 Tax=Ditylenchus dipsaci TaxID=166011 RepID=A0A915D3V4_9BILA
MEESIKDPPSFCSRLCSSISVSYQHYLDRLTPYTSIRWTIALSLVVIFVWRVFMIQGFYIVTYALFIYYLNLFLAFLTPKIDPAMDFESDEEDGPVLPTSTNEEFRPFMRRLPEFKFWLCTMKSTVLADLGHVLLVLTCLTMKRQIMHMIKYRYIPFTTGKPRRFGKEDTGKVVAG